MFKKWAYKKVFRKLCECNLFVGIYDAKNEHDDFMDGIGTVMEYIAYSIDEKTGNSFLETFLKNIAKSIDKSKSK